MSFSFNVDKVLCIAKITNLSLFALICLILSLNDGPAPRISDVLSLNLFSNKFIGNLF